MRYRVRGLIIRSENTAKPASRANPFVLRWIAELPCTSSVLDFGCGKLRYTVPLAARVAQVTAVDSPVQLEREQIVNGTHSSVSDYVANHLPNVRTICVTEPGWRKRKYDYALCSNVLSAIPSHLKRLRLLREMASVLQPKGKLLVVVQFRNTYFRDFKKNPNAIRHHDGWLVKQGKHGSFYGIIMPKRLTQLCKSAGLTVVGSSIHGESSFVWASRQAITITDST